MKIKKNGPTFSLLEPLRSVGITSRNISTWCAARQVWQFVYYFRGQQPKQLEGKKLSQILRDCGQL